MHSILTRQLKKVGIQPEEVETNEKLKLLLERIDSSYQQWDRDRKRVERSLQLTSEEMSSLYETLRVETAAEKKIVAAHNKLFHDLIDQANDATFIIDAESGCFLEVNATAARHLGYSKEALVGKTVMDITDLSPDFSWKSHVLNAIQNGPQVFEVTQIRKDSSLCPVEISEKYINIADHAYLLATVRDISERKKAEKALADSEERFALAMKGSNDGLWDWDLKTNDVVFSKRWKSMLGYSENELENNFDTWERLVHPNDIDRAKQTIDDYLSGKNSKYEVEFRMQHKDGHWVDILARGNAIRGKESNEYERFVGTHVDISERKQMEAKLSYLAITDGLTSLYNRIHFNERLEDELQRAIRFKTPLSMLMLDLDYFKKINDTYGHQTGDSCLIALADLIKGVSRTVDTCARYGGEEFVIILPQTPLENAEIFAERLRQDVEEMMVQHEDQTIQYTISIGVNALNRVEEKTAEAFLKSVDSALYEAKDRGRNCVVSGALTDPSI